MIILLNTQIHNQTLSVRSSCSLFSLMRYTEMTASWAFPIPTDVSLGGVTASFRERLRGLECRVYVAR